MDRGSDFSRLHLMMAELGLSSASQLKRPWTPVVKTPVGWGSCHVSRALVAWGPLPTSAPENRQASTYTLVWPLSPTLALPFAP